MDKRHLQWPKQSTTTSVLSVTSYTAICVLLVALLTSHSSLYAHAHTPTACTCEPTHTLIYLASSHLTLSYRFIVFYLALNYLFKARIKTVSVT